MEEIAKATYVRVGIGYLGTSKVTLTKSKFPDFAQVSVIDGRNKLRCPIMSTSCKKKAQA
jgi:hypothetical protein